MIDYAYIYNECVCIMNCYTKVMVYNISMVEIKIQRCKKCLNKHVYVCENCGMGGCSTSGCEYQGAEYKRGFFSSGAQCVRCGKNTHAM